MKIENASLFLVQFAQPQIRATQPFLIW